jgi:hypothetical protein
LVGRKPNHLKNLITFIPEKENTSGKLIGCVLRKENDFDKLIKVIQEKENTSGKLIGYV